MLWIPIAIASYLLNAFAAVIDKALLNRRIPLPLSYAFYTGIASVGVAILIPFVDFRILPPSQMALAFVSGATFVVALYFFYGAIKAFDATRVVPLVFGIFTPVLTLLVSWFAIGASLSQRELIAFALFVVGGLVLMVERRDKLIRVNNTLLQGTFLAGLFFAVAFTVTKQVFILADGFFSAFIWMRFGSVLAAAVVLVTPWRRNIIQASGRMAMSSFGLFLMNKVIGAVGFIFFNYAISIGPVSLVNALKGLEYFFVFLIIAFFSAVFPRMVKESFRWTLVTQKILGIFVISAGLVILNITEIFAYML